MAGITTKEATEQLKELTGFGPSFAWWHHTEAVNLAVEALKWRRRLEKAVLPDKYTPLPGQTEE